MNTAISLVDIVRNHAQTRPEAPALSFLVDGESPSASLDYAALDQHARAIAATLQQLCLPGDRAILLYQPGIEFITAFLGCQYAGLIAVPALPPNMNRMQSTVDRLARLADNAAPAVVLTSADLLPQLRAATRETASLAKVVWQASDRVDLRRAVLWQAPSIASNDLSFLQYTSGSTSAPKGVMVSHQNLLANLEMMNETVAGAEGAKFVSWLPTFHDMGLIGMLLNGIAHACEIRLMSPLSFLKRPIRWLRAIADAGAPVISGGPNFAFDACLRRIFEREKAGLDLSNWKAAFCGAETVRAGTMERFYAAFAPHGLERAALLPCYGLAEATLIVSGRTHGRDYQVRELDQAELEQGRATAPTQGPSEAGPSEAPTCRVVSCGSTKGSQEIAIVDPETARRRPDGEVGEIWVRGANVARGYWRDEARTTASFAATVATTEAAEPNQAANDGGPFLRTGDLGFMLDGELFVTGRVKEIIIVRGRCLYPQDLELMVESMVDEFPELVLDQAVAFMLHGDTREQIGLVTRVNRHKNKAHDPEVLVAAIQARALAQFEVGFDAIVLVKASTPKTSSGKKMRSVCREWYCDGSLDALEPVHRFVAPVAAGVADTPARAQTGQAEPEQASQAGEPGLDPDELAGLIAEWIAAEANIDRARMSTTQPLTDFALDSFAAVCLLEHLEQRLGRSISGGVLQESHNIEELSRRLVARRA